MISVKDRLPEMLNRREGFALTMPDGQTYQSKDSFTSDEVLTYDESTGEFGIDVLLGLDGESPAWLDMSGNAMNVSHWMPLPKMQQVKTEAPELAESPR